MDFWQQSGQMMEEFALSPPETRGDTETETKQLTATTMTLVEKFARQHPHLTRQDSLDEILATSLEENLGMNDDELAERQAELKSKILDGR